MSAAENQLIARAAKTIGMSATQLRRRCAAEGVDPLDIARALLRGRTERSRFERRAKRYRPRAEAISVDRQGGFIGLSPSAIAVDQVTPRRR